MDLDSSPVYKSLWLICDLLHLILWHLVVRRLNPVWCCLTHDNLIPVSATPLSNTGIGSALGISRVSVVLRRIHLHVSTPAVYCPGTKQEALTWLSSLSSSSVECLCKHVAEDRNFALWLRAAIVLLTVQLLRSGAQKVQEGLNTIIQ